MPKVSSRQLEKAIEAVDLALVRQLIEKGAPLNKPFRGGRLPLEKAVLTRNASLVKLLLAGGADVNGVSGTFWVAAVILAAALGLFKVVQVLIEAGADVNRVDAFGESALQYAACEASQRHTKTVQALIAAGADVNNLSGRSSSPLMRACCY